MINWKFLLIVILIVLCVTLVYLVYSNKTNLNLNLNNNFKSNKEQFVSPLQTEFNVLNSIIGRRNNDGLPRLLNPL